MLSNVSCKWPTHLVLGFLPQSRVCVWGGSPPTPACVCVWGGARALDPASLDVVMNKRTLANTIAPPWRQITQYRVWHIDSRLYDLHADQSNTHTHTHTYLTKHIGH